jgi:hypothetical protein
MKKGTAMTNTILDEEFDIDNTPTSKFDPLPPGTYPAEIIVATVGPLKSGRGQAVSATWQITQGEFERRQVYQSILISHDSPKAESIGRSMFKDICSACGIVGKITDLETLQFKECAIKVRIEQGKDGYDDKNRIARVIPIGAMATPAQLRQAETNKAAKAAEGTGRGIGS